MSENIEKVIKVETDMLDDYVWESRIEITNDVTDQNNVILPEECQVFIFCPKTLIYINCHDFKNCVFLTGYTS